MLEHSIQTILSDWHLYAMIFCATFASVFLSGFQHMNVNGRHYKMIFVTSCAMDFFKVAVVTLVVSAGIKVAIFSGTAAGLGMVLSVRFHDRIFKSKRDL